MLIAFSLGQERHKKVKQQFVLQITFEIDLIFDLFTLKQFILPHLTLLIKILTLILLFLKMMSILFLWFL